MRSVLAYRLEDDESREEIKDGVEPGRYDGGDLMVGGERHGHHAVICEVEEREEHDPGVPEKFESSPFKRYHGECYQAVRYCLDKAVWYLNQDLHIMNQRRLAHGIHANGIQIEHESKKLHISEILIKVIISGWIIITWAMA